LIVDGDAAGLRRLAFRVVARKFETTEMLAIGIEFLNAGVVEVGDEDLVLFADRNADGRMKLAWLVAFLAPGEDEFGLGFFLSGKMGERERGPCKSQQTSESGHLQFSSARTPAPAIICGGFFCVPERVCAWAWRVA